MQTFSPYQEIALTDEYMGFKYPGVGTDMAVMRMLLVALKYLLVECV
jgi:hypothetical protein